MHGWGFTVALAAAMLALRPLTGVRAMEQAWEIVGSFVSLKDGDPNVAVLRLHDGRLLEVPIEALSESSRKSLESHRGGDERQENDGVEMIPAAVAEAMITCRTPGEVADTCRLVLAAGDMPPAVRKAVEAVRDRWDAKAVEGLVRHDNEWVSADVAAAAANAADELIRQAAEMARLGNLRLAEEKLRDASDADPGDGRADFLIGLAYLGGLRPDVDKAQTAFTNVVRRNPAHAAAWNNLAVCELQRRRYPAAVEGFRSAIEQSCDPQTAVVNLAYVIRLASDRRSRVPARVVDDVEEIYHRLLRSKHLAPPENVTAPIVLRLDGAPAGPNGLDELVGLAAGQNDTGVAQDVIGLVIAPGIVAVPSDAIRRYRGSGLEVRGGEPVRVTAELLSTIADGDMTLLACEGLVTAPVAWAEASPGEEAEVFLIGFPGLGEPAGATRTATRARAITGLTGHERRRMVLESDAAAGAGAAIMDQAGRLLGFVGTRPMMVRDAHGQQKGRLLGLPIEELRAVLKAKKRVAPPAVAEAEPVSADAVAGFVTSAVVTVSAALPDP